MVKFVVLKASYQHIHYPFGKSFHIERFDTDNPCRHDGLHLHHSYEIVFIKNGKGKIIVEGKEIMYHDGVLLFLGPSIPHYSFSNRLQEDNFEIVIHFNENFVDERIRLFPEFSGMFKLIKKSKQFLIFDEAAKQCQTPLFEEICKLDEAAQVIAIFDLILKLSRSQIDRSLIKESLGERYAQNKQVEKIFDFINENYQNQISTKDVAQYIGLTTNSFCRMFKKLTERSFIAYLKEYRIHRAVKLLEETGDNISTIMYQCGFENPSYFSKVFADLKKKKPIEYREHFRKIRTKERSK